MYIVVVYEITHYVNPTYAYAKYLCIFVGGINWGLEA